jgi:hypothetical protein
MERLPRRRRAGATGTSRIGRLAPVVSADAIEVGAWPMSTWTVE